MARWIRTWVVAGLILGTLTSCTPMTETMARQTQQPAASGCDSVAIAGLVDGFFRAWNAQDSAGVVALFSPTFSVEDGLPSGRTMVSDPAALTTYIAQRFAAGDMFSDVHPDVPSSPAPATANAIAAFSRHAGTSQLHGNAKFVCSDGRLRRLTMSAE
jgi:hypothetical protein